MGVRKCSKCGKTGHNSRTCRDVSSRRGNCMRLFGVELAKVASPNDGDHGFGITNTNTNANSKSLSTYKQTTEVVSSSDQDSDKLKHINGTAQSHRKKGIPWSEEEHRLFLIGLEKLGKGNWRGISRNFVTTRTSTQVASHAQKYFLRRNNININANKNKFTPTTILSNMQVRRNEGQCCNYSKKKTNMNPPPLAMAPSYFCRLFAAQNSPSLDLSLAAPAAVWERRPVVLWKNQYLL